jgi:hypothetical protein
VDWTFAHFRIVFDAYDSSNLPELLDSVEWPAGDGPAQRWPRLSLEEARASLLDLVEAGLIILRDEDEVPKREAIKAIKGEAAWANRMPDTPAYYEIDVTPEGERVYANELLPRFWPEGVVRE